MNTIPQHISDKANKMIAAGTKMTFEAICAMYMKSESKSAKKTESKKENAKWEQRANVEANAGEPMTMEMYDRLQAAKYNSKSW
jgi:hypothetical protein